METTTVIKDVVGNPVEIPLDQFYTLTKEYTDGFSAGFTTGFTRSALVILGVSTVVALGSVAVVAFAKNRKEKTILPVEETQE